MSNKIYNVMKDGGKLETMKTLSAAKKLADEEGAEVYVDGKCVYTGQKASEGTKAEIPDEAPEPAEEKAVEPPEPSVITAEPIIAERLRQPEVKEPKTERYRLKGLMNVRRKPSMDAQIISTKSTGTVVCVLGIEQDWMHLTEGSYILYEGGRWAEKIQ